MTIKELYEKAVEGGYENLPLYIRDYSNSLLIEDSEVEIFRVTDDKVIFI